MEEPRNAFVILSSRPFSASLRFNSKVLFKKSFMVNELPFVLEENLINAGDLIAKNKEMPLVFLYSEELVSHAIAKMTKYGISQIPVLKDNKFVGSILYWKAFCRAGRATMPNVATSDNATF